HVDQIANTVRMRKPTRLPHGVFGMMRQDLDAAFRHRHRLDPCDRESGDARAAFSLPGRCICTKSRPGNPAPAKGLRAVAASETEKAARCSPERQASAASSSPASGVSEFLNSTSI